jgi:protein-S-isoprenylcysteine O-methyltransferase Ste14
MSLMPALRIGVWNAWLFMSVFLLQMLPIMFASKQVWQRSHVPAEARRNWLDRHVGILGNLVWLLALVYSIFLPLRLGTAWFCTGFLVFVAGLLLLAAATFAFITAPAGEPITRGAYRFSRHPMYVASLLICMGSAVAGASGLFMVLSVLMAACFWREALVEEAYCLDTYGAAYREYARATPRWIGVPRRQDGG